MALSLEKEQYEAILKYTQSILDQFDCDDEDVMKAIQELERALFVALGR